MKILRIGKITKQFMFPAVLSAFYVLVPIGKNNINGFDKIHIQEDSFGHHPLFYIWVMFFAESLISIPYLFEKFYIEKDDKQNVQNKRFKNYSKIKLFCFIFVLFLMDFIATLCGNLYEVNGANLFENFFKIIFFFISIFLTSKILKYEYYRHHAIGVIFLSIGVGLNAIMDIIVGKTKKIGKDNTRPTLVFISLGLLGQTITAFQEILEKYLMDTIYVEPLFLATGEGIVGTIVLGFFFILFDKIDCPNIENNYFPFYLCRQNKQNKQKLEDFVWCLNFIFSHYEYLLSYIIIIVGLLIFNAIRTLTIYHFSPIHKSMGNIFKLFFFWIFSLLIPFYGASKDVGYNIGVFFSYVFMIFGVFIFLEIIIVEVCNLDLNTKAEIIKREKEESIIEENIELYEH